MGAMLGDEQGLWLGQIEHLPSAVARGHDRRQRRSAAYASLGIVIDDDVRGLHLKQGLAWMPLLTAGGLSRWLAQVPDPSRLLQPFARRRLAAVAAVEAEPALQFGDVGLQACNQLPQRGDLRPERRALRRRCIFGLACAIGLIRRLSHWKLDSRRLPSRQAASPKRNLGSNGFCL